MSNLALGISGIAALLGLIALRVPIAFALAAVGISGIALYSGLSSAAAQIHLVLFENGTNILLLALPMFILMGQLINHSGIAADLFEAAYKWFGRMPGGLAVTTVIACAGFGAVTGSSPAAVATMGPMVMPEMRKYGYDLRLATGSLASAGTLAIMIPPSVILIVYGIWTETSIGKLFIAGIVPGLILTLLFVAFILAATTLRPAAGPRGLAFSWTERIRSLTKVLPTIVIFLIVLGGIYGGVFTPTEASAIGVLGVVTIATVMGRLSFEMVRASLYEAGLTTAVIFLIVIGGVLLSRFLVQTHLTAFIIDWIVAREANPLVVIALITIMYLILGMVLDVFGMLLLTLPFVFPVVTALGYDPVWFGIYVVVVTEIALITPPIGINVFIMRDVAPDVPLGDIFLGVLPFVLICLAFVIMLVFYPAIALWLPGTMG